MERTVKVSSEGYYPSGFGLCEGQRRRGDVGVRWIKEGNTRLDTRVFSTTCALKEDKIQSDWRLLGSLTWSHIVSRLIRRIRSKRKRKGPRREGGGDGTVSYRCVLPWERDAAEPFNRRSSDSDPPFPSGQKIQRSGWTCT